MRCKRWDWKTGEKSAECVAQCGCCCCCCCCCAISVYYHHHFFPSWLTLQVTRSHSHSHSHTVSHFYDNAGMEDAAATKMPLLRPATILSLANWWLNGRKEGKKKEKNWQVNGNNIHSISPADTCCERVKSAHTHTGTYTDTLGTGHSSLLRCFLLLSVVAKKAVCEKVDCVGADCSGNHQWTSHASPLSLQCCCLHRCSVSRCTLCVCLSCGSLIIVELLTFSSPSSSSPSLYLFLVISPVSCRTQQYYYCKTHRLKRRRRLTDTDRFGASINLAGRYHWEKREIEREKKKSGQLPFN